MLFGGNERKELELKMKQEGRLPPGQSLTLKWPVLHYGSVPRFDPDRWDFRVYGLVEAPARWTWKEFNEIPKIELVRDFHCVTAGAASIIGGGASHFERCCVESS